MDREVDVGFVKDEPAFHELQCVDVHADEMVCIASPDASARGARRRPTSAISAAEQFVLHHLCSDDGRQRILRLFEQNGDRCRIVAELWSFENIKSFVQEEVGLAIVPGVTVRQELATARWCAIPLRGARDAAAHADDLPRTGLRLGLRARADQDRARVQLGPRPNLPPCRGACGDGGRPRPARSPARGCRDLRAPSGIT